MRFVVGIGLAVASIVGVVSYVNASTVATPVWIVLHPVASGQKLSRDDVRLMSLELGSSRANYLEGAADPTTFVLKRPLFPGELVPRSALEADPSDERVGTVLTISAVLPEGVSVGKTVEVWASSQPSLRSDSVVVPFVVTDQAEVVRITTGSGFASSSTSSVEIRMPRDSLSNLLQAQSEGLQFSLIVGSGRS
ncbi:MAG TPA: hypothetical protein VK139_00655 [Microbacteriaceae bacterium]|nr:hypothetical protein [Microbacteriaceae bacterium]